MSGFYAYVHARPGAFDATSVFYVGKGRRDRMRDFSHRNQHHKNIVTKHGRENILAGKLECSDESTAMLLEQGLIKHLRRMGVKLANVTAGGEGLSGHRHSEATKAKMRAAATGRPRSEATKAKLRAANLGKQGTFTGKTHSDEARAKISAARKGKPNPSARRACLDEVRARISATKLSKPVVQCSHCEVSGRMGGAMTRYHFDNCKRREKA
jgi:group I intron endonuclease